MSKISKINLNTRAKARMEMRSSLDDFEEEENHVTNNIYAFKRTSTKRNSSSSASNNDSASSNQCKPNGTHLNSRQYAHRQSVRSISEAPNVIGAQTVEINDDYCNNCLTLLTWLFVILTFPFSFFFIFRVIQEYERGLIYKVLLFFLFNI
jgi:hypothetical protein